MAAPNYNSAFVSLVKKNYTTLNTLLSGGFQMVDSKGELLVGEGTKGEILDPSTAIDNDILIKDSSEPLGVKWGSLNLETKSSVYQPTDPTTLTSSQVNSVIIINDTENVVVNLPLSSTVNIGDKFWIAVADFTCFLRPSGADLLVDKTGTNQTQININVGKRAFVYFIGGTEWRVHGELTDGV